MSLGISMDSRAHYVLPTFWQSEGIRTGPLTSKRIHQYQLKGFYGEKAQKIAEHRENLNKERATRTANKTTTSKRKVSMEELERLMDI